MKKIVIIGAGGHGKVVADIARLKGYDEIVFLDDTNPFGFCNGYPIVGNTECIDNFDEDFFVAIGNADAREDVLCRLKEKNKYISTLVHPSAVVGKNVSIGIGTVVMAGVVINSCTVINEGCIINTCSSLDHDNFVDSYVHIAVGAHLCGTVNIGKKTWIGAGAIVSNNLSICDKCTIGAGATVVKDIEEQGIYVGVPAKKN